ncbi:MAG: lipid-A-disaccharide synthase [Pseudomonadota bacterium]
MLRVALVAGEVSGDNLGAGLIAALRARVPDIHFEGVGGEAMAAAGMECWYPADALAVMGLTEVIRHLPRLLRLRRDLRRRWQVQPPDVFVGIDAPDFNLGLERRLKSQGIPTVHYVSPSVWAWREGRVKTIARACDRVLCLLPFEPDFYAKHAVAADFVGHPLAAKITHQTDTSVAKQRLGLASDKPVLAMLPGSRLGEIGRLGPDFVDAIGRLLAAHTDLQVIAPLATDAGRERFESLLQEFGLAQRVRTSVGDARACMAAADVLMMASGTATLEGMLHGRPMVVAYRVAPSTYRLVRALKLMKVDMYSLPNLLTGERLVDELIQDDLSGEALAQSVAALLDNPERVTRMQHAFRSVHETLACDSDALAADAVLATAGYRT